MKITCITFSNEPIPQTPLIRHPVAMQHAKCKVSPPRTANEEKKRKKKQTTYAPP
jgi:hypothetical protein